MCEDRVLVIKLVCVSVVLGLLDLSLSSVNCLHPDSHRNRSSWFHLKRVMRNSDPWLTALDSKLKHSPVSKFKIKNVYLKSGVAVNQVAFYGNQTAFWNFTSHTSKNLSKNSKSLHRDFPKQKKHDLPNHVPQVDKNEEDGYSFLLKEKLKTFWDFLKLLSMKSYSFMGNKDERREHQESIIRRRYRHLVKRQSDLITEHCRQLGRRRCLAVPLGQCTQMCINGQRFRTVCRLQNQQTNAVCIVKNSNQTRHSQNG